MADNQYLTPIHPEVFERLPMVLAGETPFEVRISAFPGDEGEQAFSIDIYTDAQRIEPDDRRSKPYIEAMVTSVFFTAEGGFDGEPQTTTTRYRG